MRKFESVEKLLQELEGFIEDEVLPAAKELEALNDDQRKHIQRLIYTNLVDRFDYTIDKCLLELVLYPKYRDELLKEVKEVQLHEDEMLKYFLMDENERTEKIKLKMQEITRNKRLNRRNAQKLEELFGILNPNESIKAWRVNESTGDILSKRKGNARIPLSIIGYADWLYCRRNAIVHGGQEKKLSQRDLDHLQSAYKINPSSGIKIQLGTISTAAKFYKNVVNLLNNK